MLTKKPLMPRRKKRRAAVSSDWGRLTAELGNLGMRSAAVVAVPGSDAL